MNKILVLLTLLCASQLYGMVIPQKKADNIVTLPTELKKEIIVLLTTSDTMEEAIQAIHSLTETDKKFNVMINDPIITRTIIRLLAQKFNAPSEYIAKKLSTQGSQQYIKLYVQLQQALYMKNFVLAENLIKAGADIDYQKADVYPVLCAPDKVIKLLNMLNGAVALQATIADIKESLLIIQKTQIKDLESQEELIASYEEKLTYLIPNINVMVQKNKNSFEDNEQFNQVKAEINKQNFKKAFAIIEPNTIMSHDPTFYWYEIEEQTDMCIIGANFSLVMHAIATNQRDLLEWLLKHKANLELSMGTGDTALTMAINLGKKEIIKLLVNNGANVNQQNILQANEEMRDKINELNIVAINGYINKTDSMYTLLNNFILASIFKSGHPIQENTPLIHLLYSRKFTKQELYDLFMLFLINGADPNIQNNEGNTPLIVLTSIKNEGSAKLMELLLKYGANPFIQDNDEMTALDYMRSQKNAYNEEEDPEQEEKIQLLEDAMNKRKNNSYKNHAIT